MSTVAVVIDIGCSYCKIGFGTDPTPRCITKTHLRFIGNGRTPFSNAIKRYIIPNGTLPTSTSTCLTPYILVDKKNTDITYTEWQEICHLLVNDLFFEKLKLIPEYTEFSTNTYIGHRRDYTSYKDQHYNLMLILNPMTSALFKKALVTSFRNLNIFGSIRMIENSLKCALLSTGLTSGLVIDIGYFKTRIQNMSIDPQYDTIMNDYTEYDLGFAHVMEEFKVLSKERARLDFDRFSVEAAQIENAITRACFVKPRNTVIHPNSTTYEFRKCRQSAFVKITPWMRQFLYESIFFDPTQNIAIYALDEILKYPMEINNIILTGGTAQIMGFRQRFVEEIEHHINNDDKYMSLRGLEFNLIKSEFKPNAAMFVGGCIYSQLLQEKHYLITMDEKDLNYMLVIGYMRESIGSSHICMDVATVVLVYSLTQWLFARY